MRCLACDRRLSPFEATRKYESTMEYVDLCQKCFHGLGIVSIDREDLKDEFYEDEVQEVWSDEDFGDGDSDVLPYGLSIEDSSGSVSNSTDRGTGRGSEGSS